MPTAKRVHDIRREFHNQLKELWELCPLCENKKKWLDADDSKLKKTIDGRKFVFLVSKALDMYAKLDIQVLVYSKDRKFKDIDNKLKTICDALRLPARGELKRSRSKDDETPLFCLLQDDESIYQIAVDTDFLLCKHPDSNFRLKLDESMWIINVKIKGNRFHENYLDLLV